MRWWMAGAVVAVGCIGTPPSDGGQFGEEGGARCGVVSRTPLAVDEVSPLGFSAQDVLPVVSGPRTETLSWSDGTTTELQLEVAPTGVYEYVEQAVVDDGTGTGSEPALAPWCPNEISIAASTTFATADGAFAEALPDPVLAATADAATLTDSLEQVAGTYDVWDHVPAGNDYDDARSWLDVTFSATGVAGAISGQGSGTDGDVAWAEAFEVASFGDAPSR
jgi:hypothetical protein